MTFPRYPAYKDSGVAWLGEIPAHWDAIRLKHTANIINDRLDTKPEEAMYLGLENIESQTGHLLIEATAEQVESIVGVFQAGDVLFGKLRPYLAKVVLPDFSGVCTTELLTIRPGQRGYGRFLLYQLLSESTIKLIDSYTYGSKMPRVNAEQIGNTVFPLPPKEEQRTIAAFLDAETARIDTLVAKQTALIATLQEKRRALISHVVTKGLDPVAPMRDSGVPWLGEVPTHWDVRPLGNISANIQTGPFGSQLHAEDYVEDGVPVINPAHIQAGCIVPDPSCTISEAKADELLRHRMASGDIVFGRRGEMGRCAEVLPEQAGWLCGTGSLRVELNHELMLSRFAMLVLSNQGVKEQLELESVGSTMSNLNTTILFRLRLPLPSLQEQQRVIDILDQETAQIDTLIAKAEEMIALLREHRVALIAAAVTGQIDVRGWVGHRKT